MSPILVRPVREQLEHDRIIRLLQTKNRRKFEAGINPGAEQNVSIGSGPTALHPDVVLSSPDRRRRIETIIEVETGESVNHLEALSQWVPFARSSIPFHLYVPSTMVDVARRLCEENQIDVHEIWSFHAMGDDVRFALVQRLRGAAAPPARRPALPAPPRPPQRKAAPPRRQTRVAKPPSRGKTVKKVKKAVRSPKRK